jgi:DNA-binding beta-propeller fold protein YncE
VYDGSNIWVSNPADNTVTELRASDGANLATYNVGYYPQGLASAGNHIVVANADATISQL